jgi:transcriptional regulator with XRE-family HTH domain
MSAERIFGRRMKRERIRRGWRQEDLAAAVAECGVTLHLSTYAKIEGGSRTITLNEAMVIAGALAVPLHRMLSDDDVSELARRVDELRGDLDKAMAESDDALTRAVDIWKERRSLIRDLVSDGEMAVTPAEDPDTRYSEA